MKFDTANVVTDNRYALSIGGRFQPMRHIGLLGLDAEAMSQDDPITSGLNSVNVGLAGHFELAEGATGAFFDLFVLIANPNPTAATIDVEYLLVGGGSLTKTYTVAGNSRSTIWVDDEELPAASGVKPLANTAVSMIVRSTNAVPSCSMRRPHAPATAAACCVGSMPRRRPRSG